MRDRFSVSGGMVVNNHFSKPANLSWIYAFSACSMESTAVFDSKGGLLTYNNRFGTLDGAGQHDIVDINSLFRYYARHYRNANEGLTAMRNVFNGRLPVVFTLHHNSGWSCYCRAYPVLSSDYALDGVVMLAFKENAPTRTNVHDRRGADASYQ